jgi:hypothetical protein
MPTGVKFIFTVFVGLVVVCVLFVRARTDNAGPSWLWRGGSGDIFRSALFRRDGSFRKYTKLGILIWLSIFVAAIWLAIPTSP